MECDRCCAHQARNARIVAHLRAVRARTPKTLPTSQEIRERLREQVLAIQMENARKEALALENQESAKAAE